MNTSWFNLYQAVGKHFLNSLKAFNGPVMHSWFTVELYWISVPCVWKFEGMIWKIITFPVILSNCPLMDSSSFETVLLLKVTVRWCQLIQLWLLTSSWEDIVYSLGDRSPVCSVSSKQLRKLKKKKKKPFPTGVIAKDSRNKGFVKVVWITDPSNWESHLSLQWSWMSQRRCCSTVVMEWFLSAQVLLIISLWYKEVRIKYFLVIFIPFIM